MDRPRLFPRIRPVWALAVLAVVAASAVPIVASIRASGRPAPIADEASKPTSTPISIPGKAPVPGRGALPVCPPSRFGARPIAAADAPEVEADLEFEKAGSTDRMTPKGRF